MKKYLYFFVALFATMSFTLTSCSDDDDEPNGNNGSKSSFTINGTAFGTNDDWAWVQNIEAQDVATFQAQLSTSKGEYPWIQEKFLPFFSCIRGSDKIDEITYVIFIEEIINHFKEIRRNFV